MTFFVRCCLWLSGLNMFIRYFKHIKRYVRILQCLGLLFLIGVVGVGEAQPTSEERLQLPAKSFEESQIKLSYHQYTGKVRFLQAELGHAIRQSSPLPSTASGDGCTIIADDVVVHELTHGVTEYESDLFYIGQSGAINESFSDIWGEFVDLSNGLGNDSPEVRWQMGEDTSTGPFRNLQDPTLHDDPDCMTSSYYYCGRMDNGGVHTNSGVGNKAASLMVDGGTFNGHTVSGLGISKVADLFYEAQTNLLTSAMNYADLYDTLLLACSLVSSRFWGQDVLPGYVAKGVLPGSPACGASAIERQNTTTRTKRERRSFYPFYDRRMCDCNTPLMVVPSLIRPYFDRHQ